MNGVVPPKTRVVAVLPLAQGQKQKLTFTASSGAWRGVLSLQFILPKCHHNKVRW